MARVSGFAKAFDTRWRIVVWTSYDSFLALSKRRISPSRANLVTKSPFAAQALPGLRYGTRDGSGHAELS